jgi:hypothetical protein
LLRTPPAGTTIAKAGGHSKSSSGRKKSMHVIATTSRSDAACNVINELFEEVIGMLIVVCLWWEQVVYLTNIIFP